MRYFYPIRIKTLVDSAKENASKRLKIISVDLEGIF